MFNVIKIKFEIWIITFNVLKTEIEIKLFYVIKISMEIEIITFNI
mgnify:FL=1